MGGWATGTLMMNKSLQLETGFSRSSKSVILSLFISVTSQKVTQAWGPVTWDGQIEGVGLQVLGMVPVVQVHRGPLTATCLTLDLLSPL